MKLQFDSPWEAHEWVSTMHQVLNKQIKKPKYHKRKAELDQQAKKLYKIDQYKKILDDIKETNRKLTHLIYDKEKFENVNKGSYELT
jgi:hypothetical protein